jgi:desampylase
MKLKLESMFRITDWAAKHPEIEVTGFVKRFGSGMEVVVPMRNLSSTPTTDYAWDTTEMMEQWAQMDRENSEPIAIYHSHPGGRSEPSEVDMQAALMVDMMYIIAYPESHELHSGDGTLLRTVLDWRVSGWRCLEQGILMSEPLELGA